MLTTPVLGLPYPVENDTADVPRDVHALATKLDSYSSLHPPMIAAGGALPGSPIDGQECYYIAASGPGAVWHLRSNGSTAWIFLGGAALWNNTDAAISVPALNSWSSGMQLTLPLAGTYEIGMYFEGYSHTTPTGSFGAQVFRGAGVAGALVANSYCEVQWGALDRASLAGRTFRASFAAGEVITEAFYTTVAANVRSRIITAIPALIVP